MAKNQLVLVDTCVFVELLRKNDTLLNRIERAFLEIGQGNIAVNSIIEAEIYRGAANRRELRLLTGTFSTFTKLGLDGSVERVFLELIAKYTLSHKIHIADALIAATALAHSIPLYTFNVKDFNFISGLKLYVNQSPS
jgi:predicted nucleic acid-binding protein